ncbi:MAG: hypothetical protein HZB65_04310 [Candidatus Aenigmarchaeota archaeon]|nr:hypothetical protein [Candidatus Aenigmarchaeota archaeon]
MIESVLWKTCEDPNECLRDLRERGLKIYKPTSAPQIFPEEYERSQGYQK